MTISSLGAILGLQGIYMSSYNHHNPLYNFCNKIEARFRSIGWTGESYTEMIGRLCYLIDNGQSLHRCIIGEPIKQEFNYFEFRGQKIPVPSKVDMSDQVWGTIDFLPLNHDSYLVNVNLTGGDGCWTFAGQRFYERGNGVYSEPLLLRTPYTKDLGEDIDIALEFFEPNKIEEIDYHNDCVNHFFDVYKGNEIKFDVWTELQHLQERYGRPL